MGKKDKLVFLKKGDADVYTSQSRFIDKLKAAGVDEDNLHLMMDRLRYERAQAELAAAKAYCEAEGLLNSNGTISVDEMVSLIVRRCQGLQVAIEGIASDLGRTSTSYNGLAQLAWDVTNLAERVEAIMSAENCIDYAKKIAIV